MSDRHPVPEDKSALMEACSDAVLRRRLGRHGTSDAEDVAQDACVRALSRPEPETVREPARYLMRVARNLFIDRQRGRQRETVLLRSLEDVQPKNAEVDPERILAGKQELERVLVAIDALPPRCREAFTLHRFHALSYAAIARRMGVSTGTVEKHIAEAMLRLGRVFRAGGEGVP